MNKNKLIYILLFFLFLGYSDINAQAKGISEENKRKFDYFFYEAAKAKAQNNYDEAFDFLQYCLGIDTTNAEVYFQLGGFYNTLDNKNEAMNCYRNAVLYNGDNLYYNMAFATLCLEFKQYSDAISVYELLVNKYPENQELYLYLSESYRLDGDIQKAVEALNKLEQLIGLNEKISLQKFQLYTVLKQEDKAFAEIKKYIDKYPTETKYQILLGDLYLQAGKKNEAFLIYSKAKAADPENPYLITSMAEYYEQTNNKAAAESELKTALISPKMDIDTKLGILAQYVGTLKQNKQDINTANPLFDTLLVQHPQEPKLNMMYGNLLMIQEKKTEARSQYKIFAEANPTNPMGWEQMLMTAYPDSLDLSLAICDEAIKNIPDQPQFYFYKGLTNYLRKDYKQALETLQKGIQYVDEQQTPLLSDFYGQMGDLYYQLNKSDSAFWAYDKALEYNPQNLGILNNYSYYLSLEKKNLDKAEKMSSLTIKAEPSNPTYLDTYGWVLFEQGAYLMAKIYIENAIKYSKEKNEDINAEVYEHYGDVLYKSDKKEKALEYWMKAKEAEQKNTGIDSRRSKTLDKKIESKTYIAE